MPPIKRTNLARCTNCVRRNQSTRDSQTQEERVILNEASRVHMKQLREMLRSGLRNRSIMDLNHAAFKYKFTKTCAALISVRSLWYARIAKQ